MGETAGAQSGASECEVRLRALCAYLKAARREALSPEELAAISAVPGLPVREAWGGINDLAGLAGLGFLHLYAPASLLQLDALAEFVASRSGAPEHVGWQAIHDYSSRALAVAREEAGLSDQLASA